MKITNDTNSYGFLARLFHWITFVILMFQLPLGIYLDNIEFSEFKLSIENVHIIIGMTCLLYTSPSPRDATLSRMPSSA